MGEIIVIPKLYSDIKVDYNSMRDKDIVELFRGGDSLALDYLLDKYKNFVISRSMPYFIVGGDREDIIQEGMIGLFKAIRDYDDSRGTSFISFVEICITRHMITAIKTATRKKHLPLNSYISLNKAAFEEDSARSLIDIVEGSHISDPLEVYLSEEETIKMEKSMNSILTDLELQVITSYLKGKSYKEISFEIERDHKCIDNALQRIKKKLSRYIIN